jgi:hypothetical protein
VHSTDITSLSLLLLLLVIAGAYAWSTWYWERQCDRGYVKAQSCISSTYWLCQTQAMQKTVSNYMLLPPIDHHTVFDVLQRVRFSITICVYVRVRHNVNKARAIWCYCARLILQFCILMLCAFLTPFLIYVLLTGIFHWKSTQVITLLVSSLAPVATHKSAWRGRGMCYTILVAYQWEADVKVMCALFT